MSEFPAYFIVGIETDENGKRIAKHVERRTKYEDMKKARGYMFFNTMNRNGMVFVYGANYVNGYWEDDFVPPPADTFLASGVWGERYEDENGKRRVRNITYSQHHETGGKDKGFETAKQVAKEMFYGDDETEGATFTTIMAGTKLKAVKVGEDYEYMTESEAADHGAAVEDVLDEDDDDDLDDDFDWEDA